MVRATTHSFQAAPIINLLRCIPLTMFLAQTNSHALPPLPVVGLLHVLMLLSLSACSPSITSMGMSSRSSSSRHLTNSTSAESGASAGVHTEASRCENIPPGRLGDPPSQICKIHDVIYLPGEMAWARQGFSGAVTLHARRWLQRQTYVAVYILLNSSISREIYLWFCVYLFILFIPLACQLPCTMLVGTGRLKHQSCWKQTMARHLFASLTTRTHPCWRVEDQEGITLHTMISSSYGYGATSIYVSESCFGLKMWETFCLPTFVWNALNAYTDTYHVHYTHAMCFILFVVLCLYLQGTGFTSRCGQCSYCWDIGTCWISQQRCWP